jgi:hypothetical protein
MPPVRCTAHLDQTGRAAAATGRDSIALASALPPGHDPGFARSRELAQELCDLAIASAAELDPARVADLAAQVLASPGLSDWQLSLSVLQASPAGWRVLNCGTTGVLCAGRIIHPVCAPQTLARRLREDGETDVPRHAASIGLTFLSLGSDPADIEVVAIDPPAGSLLLAVAEPLLFEELLTVEPAALNSEESIADELGRRAAAFGNTERTWVALRREP